MTIYYTEKQSGKRFTAEEMTDFLLNKVTEADAIDQIEMFSATTIWKYLPAELKKLCYEQATEMIWSDYFKENVE